MDAEGLYCLWAIARAADGNADLPRKPAFVTLRVVEAATGAERTWSVQITHRERYFAVAQIYFPAYAGGKYTATLSLDAKSQQALLVDRLELRDVLGHCERKALKTRRMLVSDEELIAKRADFAAGISLLVEDFGGAGGLPGALVAQGRDGGLRIELPAGPGDDGSFLPGSRKWNPARSKASGDSASLRNSRRPRYLWSLVLAMLNG